MPLRCASFESAEVEWRSFPRESCGDPRSEKPGACWGPVLLLREPHGVVWAFRLLGGLNVGF
jgi:hypothetical protein